MSEESELLVYRNCTIYPGTLYSPRAEKVFIMGEILQKLQFCNILAYRKKHHNFYIGIECPPFLTSGASVYPYIEPLCYSTGIRYVTAEDPCCSAFRVAVEQHCLRTSTSGSVVRFNRIVRDCVSIGKVPLSFRVCRRTAASTGSCAGQSCTTSSNICNIHNAVVSIECTIQD